jgi:hypothetical protein
MIVDLAYIKSGFSDKLRAITFHIALNNLNLKNKSKIFYIYEKQTIECPFRFIDYCKIKNIKIIQLKKRKKSSVILNSYNTEINLKNAIKNNPYKSIDNISLFREWKQSYKKILPSKKITLSVDKIKIPKKLIGIHLRTTDRTLKLKNMINIQFQDTIYDTQLEYFKKNIVKIIKENTSINNIYVASDSKEIKNYIIKRLEDKKYNVYYNNSIFTKKFRETSGKDFLIDFFTLLKCELILSTVGAGVTQSIYLMKKKRIINWNNKVNRFIFLRILSLLLILLKKIKKFFIS